jgi:hypothetical protein
MRVVSDREGGFIALEKAEPDRMCVVIDGISPPLLLREARQYRLKGFRAVMMLNFWLLSCSTFVWLVFGVWWWLG